MYAALQVASMWASIEAPEFIVTPLFVTPLFFTYDEAVTSLSHIYSVAVGMYCASVLEDITRKLFCHRSFSIYEQPSSSEQGQCISPFV